MAYARKYKAPSGAKYGEL